MKIEVNVPARMLKEITEHGKKIGFKSPRRALESLIQAAVVTYIWKAPKVPDVKHELLSPMTQPEVEHELYIARPKRILDARRQAGIPETQIDRELLDSIVKNENLRKPAIREEPLF